MTDNMTDTLYLDYETIEEALLNHLYAIGKIPYMEGDVVSIDIPLALSPEGLVAVDVILVPYQGPDTTPQSDDDDETEDRENLDQFLESATILPFKRDK